MPLTIPHTILDSVRDDGRFADDQGNWWEDYYKFNHHVRSIRAHNYAELLEPYGFIAGGAPRDLRFNRKYRDIDAFPLDKWPSELKERLVELGLKWVRYSDWAHTWQSQYRLA